MATSTGRTQSPGTDSLDDIFLERWSTRAFSDERLSQSEIDTLFEAARWAPSSTNSQPWVFLYATDGPERELFNSLLRPGNQTWAPAAPLLVFVAAVKGNDEGRIYRTNQFDAGAAWMSLALQATKMGLHTHAMGGIMIDDVHEQLGLSPEKYDVIVAIAVGKRGDPSSLAEDLQAREKPNDRKPLGEIAIHWKSN